MCCCRKRKQDEDCPPTRKRSVREFDLPRVSMPATASHLMGASHREMLPGPLLPPSAFQFAASGPEEAALFAGEMRFSSSSEGTPVRTFAHKLDLKLINDISVAPDCIPICGQPK